MPDTSLAELAHDLLDSVGVRMAAAGISLPDRRYIWAGLIAADCEQVVVTYEQSFQGLPGSGDATALTCVVMRTAQLAVYVIRCVPVSDVSGEPPSEAEMDDYGATILTDVHELMRSVITGYREGDFSRQCDSLGLISMTPVGPSGGFGGVVLRLQAQL